MTFSWLKTFPDTLASWSLKKRLLSAFIVGALCVLAMPPYCLWPVLLPGFSFLYLLFCSATSLRRTFFESWFFAFGYFLFGLMWIGNALLVEGNPFSWVWPLAIAGLPALLALFYATTLGLLRSILKERASLTGWISFIATLAFTEWLRGHMFTGFPWNLFGYTWNNTLTIAQSASLFGVYGLTLLTIFWAAIPALWWQNIGSLKARRLITITALLLVASSFLFGLQRLSQPINLKSDVMLRIVQPNISQEDKWDPSKTVSNYTQLLSLSASDIEESTGRLFILWPETAVTERFLSLPSSASALQAVLNSFPRPAYLSTGILRSEKVSDREIKYFNSLITYDSDLRIASQYDKSHLVPFGEYIPFNNIIPIAPFVRFEGFEKGSGPRTQDIDHILKISPLVCYEIIFPGKVSEKPAERADILMNATNDSWYGDSSGPRQHLAMTRFRAIEEGLPAARAANTGISGLYDPYGRELKSLPLSQEGVIDHPLPEKAAPTLYYRAGDLIFFLFVIVLFLPALGLSLRNFRDTKA